MCQAADTTHTTEFHFVWKQYKIPMQSIGRTQKALSTPMHLQQRGPL